MKKDIILYIILIIWVSIIFIFSSQPSIQSKKVSGGLANKIIDITENVNNQDFTEDERKKFYKISVVILRKSAHFFLYFILGILLYNIVMLYNIDNQKKLFISILFCVIYACSDEIHQLFVLGRSGELRDVLIDSIGSIFGIISVIKITKLKKIKRNL